MKSSPRNLVLVFQGSRKPRRYYNLRNAVRKALNEVVASKAPVVIYDSHRGVDIASIRLAVGQVRIYLDSPRRFNQLWNQP